jgi:hypothetical protein
MQSDTSDSYLQSGVMYARFAMSCEKLAATGGSATATITLFGSEVMLNST